MTAQTVAAPVSPTPSNPPAPQKVTAQEYLERERYAERRHEFVEGDILAMSGESPQHNRIAGNIYLRLENAFGERACTAYIEGVRTRVTSTRYRYPDVVALCGEARFDDATPPSLINPEVIFEVLSPSTEEIDRDVKFLEYRQLETLTDYVLVAQDQRQVLHYARQSDRQWLVTIHTEPDDTLALASLDVALTLAEIYRKIVFAAPPVL